MKLSKVLVIIIFLGVAATLLLTSKTDGGKIISPQAMSPKQAIITPMPTPTSTPPPIIINQNSNLEKETQTLTPEDFSEDYKLLKEEAGKF